MAPSSSTSEASGARGMIERKDPRTRRDRSSHPRDLATTTSGSQRFGAFTSSVTRRPSRLSETATQAPPGRGSRASLFERSRLGREAAVPPGGEGAEVRPRHGLAPYHAKARKAPFRADKGPAREDTGYPKPGYDTVSGLITGVPNADRSPRGDMIQDTRKDPRAKVLDDRPLQERDNRRIHRAPLPRRQPRRHVHQDAVALSSERF